MQRNNWRSKRRGYKYRHRGYDFPTVAFVLLLHEYALQESGGRPGVLQPDLLESAMEQPVISVGGRDAYATLFTKVAAIGCNIAHNHVFQDGNKRTAVATMIATLRLNGYKTKPNDVALELAILLVAAGYLRIDGLRMTLLYAYDLDTTNPEL